MRLVVEWAGHAVGENRRKEFSRRLGRAYPNQAYRDFVNSLAWTIRASSRGVVFPSPRVGIVVDAPRLDVDALVKPILDAVQLSGVVRNDRDIVGQSSERALLGRARPGSPAGPHWILVTIEGEPAA